MPSKAPHSHLELLSLFLLPSASSPQQLTPTRLYLNAPITEKPKQLLLSTSFPRSPASVTLCLLIATLPLVLLLCIVSYPLAASAASLVTTAESTALGIHQHRVATPPLLTRDFFGTSLPPVSARQPAREGELGRGSWTTAQEGGGCCCPALSSPRGGFSRKATSLETRRA